MKTYFEKSDPVITFKTGIIAASNGSTLVN